MIVGQAVTAILLSASIFIPFFCTILCLIYYLSLERNRFNAHILLIISTLSATTLSWSIGLLLVIGFVTPSFHGLFLLPISMLIPPLTYHSIFIATRNGSGEKFSPLYYGIPLIITLIWLLIPHTSYMQFLPLFLTHTFIYIGLGLRRIGKSRRGDQISVHLLRLIILAGIPLSVAVLFFGKTYVLFPYLITALICAALYPTIAYHVISGHYTLNKPVVHEEQNPVRTPPLDRVRFEKYIAGMKPYLDPKLKITDVAFGLNTNRSYVSGLINREYGKNFNRYINDKRLEELDRLRTSPENKMLSNMELLIMAGFSSYRNYRRVKTDRHPKSVNH